MTQPDAIRTLIEAECDAVKRMLVAKNAAYGNSALDPVRIFSKADPEEQIRVRIDDKLSRLARGSADGDDVELDLIGYLVLLRVSRQRDRQAFMNATHAEADKVMNNDWVADSRFGR